MTQKRHYFLFPGLLMAVMLSVGIQSGVGQSYADSALAQREANVRKLLNDPTSPLYGEAVEHLRYYTPDSNFRVHAAVEFLHHEQPFSIPTSDGTSKEYVRHAIIRFQLAGDTLALTLYRSVALFADPKYRDHLFLPFTDLTNGSETYGAGRYIDVWANDIQDGQVMIDFNHAYNPYCAYSNGYQCPIPPAENQLDVAIHAGEQTYTGPKKERPIAAKEKP